LFGAYSAIGWPKKSSFRGTASSVAGVAPAVPRDRSNRQWSRQCHVIGRGVAVMV
jgi:hypothetical protein